MVKRMPQNEYYGLEFFRSEVRNWPSSILAEKLSDAANLKQFRAMV